MHVSRVHLSCQLLTQIGLIADLNKACKVRARWHISLRVAIKWTLENSLALSCQQQMNNVYIVRFLKNWADSAAVSRGACNSWRNARMNLRRQLWRRRRYRTLTMLAEQQRPRAPLFNCLFGATTVTDCARGRKTRAQLTAATLLLFTIFAVLIDRWINRNCCCPRLSLVLLLSRHLRWSVTAIHVSSVKPLETCRFATGQVVGSDMCWLSVYNPSCLAADGISF